MPYLFSTFTLHLLHQTPNPPLLCSCPGRMSLHRSTPGPQGGSSNEQDPKTEEGEVREPPPSLPDCLKATVPWGPPPRCPLSTLNFGNLWRFKGFSPLLFPGCFPHHHHHPCLFSNLHNLFFCTIKDEISFLLGACLMQLTIPSLVNSKQYII